MSKEAETLARRIAAALPGSRLVQGTSPDEDLHLPIVDQTVDLVAAARSSLHLRFEFWGPRSTGPFYHLEIEGEAILRPAQDVPHIRLAANTDKSPALALLGRRVSRAVAYVSGELDLKFEGGPELLVPRTEFETWHLRTEDQEYAVHAMAGGGLVVFGAPRPR